MALNDHKLNNGNYLDKAFDPEQRARLMRSARMRRTVYLVICFIGLACIAVSGWMKLPLISGLSLLQSALAIVVVSKYDTQLYFLRAIEKRAQAGQEAAEDLLNVER